MSLFSKLFGSEPKADFKEMVQQGAVIIDVRTPGEFASGHIKGSINIPLDTIQQNVKDIRKMNKPIITCCKSGGRSGMAKSMLGTHGLEVHNGGPWDRLNEQIR